MQKKCPALFSWIFWLHRNTFECFATFRVQFSTFFSVKSSCAILTWQEMVISPRARNFLPGVKSPFPPGWRERMMISLKKMKRYRILSMTVAYIDSYRNIYFIFSLWEGFIKFCVLVFYTRLSIQKKTSLNLHNLIYLNNL